MNSRIAAVVSILYLLTSVSGYADDKPDSKPEPKKAQSQHVEPHSHPRDAKGTGGGQPETQQAPKNKEKLEDVHIHPRDAK
jgi:hypothetical protein